jgi:hypothetical protein
MATMTFQFDLDTNSDDVEYETTRAEGLVKRILGIPKVTNFVYVEPVPEEEG